MQIFWPKLNIAPEMAPIGMSAHEGNLLDLVAGFEHSGDTLVAQVVEMQVRDAEGVARRLEKLGECLWMMREDGAHWLDPFYFDFEPHDLPRFAEEGNPLIVAGLPAWVFPIANQDEALFSVEIIPTQATNLSAAHRCGYHELHDGPIVVGQCFDDALKLISSRPTLTFTAAPDQPDMRQ